MTYTPVHSVAEIEKKAISECKPEIPSCGTCNEEFKMDCAYYFYTDPTACGGLFGDPDQDYGCALTLMDKIQNRNFIHGVCQLGGSNYEGCLSRLIPMYGNDDDYKECGSLPENIKYDCMAKYAVTNKDPTKCRDLTNNLMDPINCCLDAKYGFEDYYITTRQDLIDKYTAAHGAELAECKKIGGIKEPEVVEECETLNCDCLSPCNGVKDNPDAVRKCALDCATKYYACQNKNRTEMTTEKRDMYYFQDVGGGFSRKHCPHPVLSLGTDFSQGVPPWVLVVGGIGLVAAAAAAISAALKRTKGPKTDKKILQLSTDNLSLSADSEGQIQASVWTVKPDGTYQAASDPITVSAPGLKAMPLTGSGKLNCRLSGKDKGDYEVTFSVGGVSAKARVTVSAADTLELTYPIGPSPKVFVEGWVFGAKCVINAGKEDEEDVSGDVKWSGTATFKPAKGDTSRPRFKAPDANTITLSYQGHGKSLKKEFGVEAVSTSGFASVGDKAKVPADAHGCPACPHPCVGPIISGSPDVLINGRPAARKGDTGTHAACCGPNTFTIIEGDPSVLINGRPAAKIGMKTQHCGGVGKIVEGAP